MGSDLLTAVGVALITWLGIFAYLWRLDTRVKSLEASISISRKKV